MTKANRKPQQSILHTLSVTEQNSEIYPLAPGGTVLVWICIAYVHFYITLLRSQYGKMYLFI